MRIKEFNLGQLIPSEKVITSDEVFFQKPNYVNLNVLIIGNHNLGKRSLVNALLYQRIFEPAKRILLNGFERYSANAQIRSNDTSLQVFFTILSYEFLTEEFFNEITCVVESPIKASQPMSSCQTAEKRFHVCLFMLSPIGIYERELALLSTICQFVNVVPIISRADNIILEELLKYKSELKKRFDQAQVHFYVPVSIQDEEDYNLFASRVSCSIPLAIGIGSGDSKTRVYKWGTFNSEEEEYSDLNLLRTLLFCTCTIDLLQTSNNLYRRYTKRFIRARIARTEKIAYESLNTFISEKKRMMRLENSLK